ncbi:MAG: hypothetical protein P1P89_16095 [Desulfobacterales bacterium]|nr:hypothetical protein [Desulfobacterales bacterium]
MFKSPTRLFVIASATVAWCALISVGYADIATGATHSLALLVGAGWSVAVLYVLVVFAREARQPCFWERVIRTEASDGARTWSNYFLAALFGSQDGSPWPAPATVMAGWPSAILAFVLWWRWSLHGGLPSNVFVLFEIATWLYIAFIADYTIWVLINVGVIRFGLLNAVRLSASPGNAYQSLEPLSRLASKLLTGSSMALLLPVILLMVAKTFGSLNGLIELWLVPWFMVLVIVVVLVVSRFVREYLVIG